jgi:hypothetical protein
VCSVGGRRVDEFQMVQVSEGRSAAAETRWQRAWRLAEMRYRRISFSG